MISFISFFRHKFIFVYVKTIVLVTKFRKNFIFVQIVVLFFLAVVSKESKTPTHILDKEKIFEGLGGPGTGINRLSVIGFFLSPDKVFLGP
jgi:hypothetical protein